MKIDSKNFEQYVQKNYQNYKVILLYGPNLGLVNLLYSKTVKSLNIDIKDPFNVTKVNGTEFKENPFILEDNINTFNILTEKKFILLDLSHISINKNIENNILNSIVNDDVNYLLIIKAGNIGSQNKLVKHLANSGNSVLTVCYEENTNEIKNNIGNILIKHKINFSNEFISNLSSLFNADSLSNKMEIEKLESFLINNKNVTEDIVLNFLLINENINLNKVVNSCLNGETRESLFYLDKIYDKSNSNIILIKMFGKRFKTLEKILLSNQHGKSLTESINNLKSPVFFKDKPIFLFHCKLWSFKKINLIQKRLIDLELKTKIGLYPEKILLSQFILSASFLAQKKVKT